jgi:transcription termination factor NusB
MDTLKPEEKRKCVFTNEKADTRLQIPKGWSERHNWAKYVPCTQEYIKKRGDYPFNDIELQLIKTFYEIEVAKLTIKAMEDRMEHLRGVLRRDFSKDVMEQSIEEARKEFYRLHAASEPMTPEDVEKDCPSYMAKTSAEEYFESITIGVDNEDEYILPEIREDIEKKDLQTVENVKKIDLEEKIPDFNMTQPENSDTIKKVVIKKKATLWD